MLNPSATDGATSQHKSSYDVEHLTKQSLDKPEVKLLKVTVKPHQNNIKHIFIIIPLLVNVKFS